MKRDERTSQEQAAEVVAEMRVLRDELLRPLERLEAWLAPKLDRKGKR